VFELDARGVCCEAPFGLCVAEVAVFHPGIDLAPEGFLVWDAPMEALAGQDGEF